MIHTRETSQVNGFMVVRKPALNKDARDRGAFSAQAPCLAGVCYAGIDRMAWFDIDEQLDLASLPEPVLRARQLIHRNNSDLTGLELCRELDVALALLHFSNSINNANELIAVRSDQLTLFKGVTTIGLSRIEWLGYDVVALGQQSLLRDGLFAVPTTFPDWKTRINTSGLLPSVDLVESYTSAYQAAASRGEVEDITDIEEEISGLGYTIIAIQVGRVLPTE